MILLHEHDEILGESIGHVDRVHNAPERFIMPPEEVYFARQVELHCPLDAGIEELCCIGTVEIAVEVSSVVYDLDIPLRCWSPVNESHQRSSMGLQSCAVLIDAVKHDGRDREDHTWRCKFSLGENVVDKAAVQAAVPILERMNINEPEGRGCGLQDRIDLVGNHAIVCFKQCRHQVGKISGPRTDEF